MTAVRHDVASRLLRLLLLSGWLAFVPAATRASAAESGAATVPVKMPAPTWAWRQAVQQEIDSQKVALEATQHNQQLSPLLLRAGTDPDVVTMAPVRVNGSRLAREIKREYAMAVKRENDAAVLRRLGTGMHMAGNSHFGVLTVFYIPVFAGFQWSW